MFIATATRCSWRWHTSPQCRHLVNLTKQRCLTSDWCFHQANWTKHTCHLWFWSICSIMWKHDIIIHKTKNLHNVLHCCYRRTKPWMQVRCTQNEVKFGCEAFEICEQTDGWTDNETCRHTVYTDMLIAIMHTPTGGDVNIMVPECFPERTFPWKTFPWQDVSPTKKWLGNILG